MKLYLSLFLTFSFIHAIEINYAIDNTNIITSTKEEIKNYNRLRLDLTLEDKEYDNSSVKLITDTDNYGISIYRGYFKYVDDKHLLSIGTQRIPFGVGRIWNPIDIFNPIDSNSIETGERKGTESIRYEYAINSVSNLDITYSKEKSSLRIKSYLDISDVALIVLNDDELNQDIIGYEIEGQLLQSGIELRSEGGYFKDKKLDDTFYKYIIGAEYGFENSLTILGEYKYESQTKSDYFGSTISYNLNTLTYLNILAIKNLDDKSYIISPNLGYSLSDEMTLSIGMFDYNIDRSYYFMKLFMQF